MPQAGGIAMTRVFRSKPCRTVLGRALAASALRAIACAAASPAAARAQPSAGADEDQPAAAAAEQEQQAASGSADAPAEAVESDIVVTGIRRSLEQAAEIKRDASQVLDVITAEDVGKLPDSNVAEALQRVTGVQITRVFGEGQPVSVRGLQQVRVEVDGRTLLGFSARLSPPENEQLGRSSGLDSVPSSLLVRLEVRKSPLASQVEGGLGGSVNLVTPKPFDFKKPVLTGRIQGVYSEKSDEIGSFRLIRSGSAATAWPARSSRRHGRETGRLPRCRSSRRALPPARRSSSCGSAATPIPGGAPIRSMRPPT
jgi:outer membrane receptor protein involved in Fe transport